MCSFIYVRKEKRSWKGEAIYENRTYSCHCRRDEPHSRSELIYLLEEHSQIEVAGEADSGQKGLELVLQKEPDVIFLDIEMSQMNGMEVAEHLKKVKKRPLLIFATAYPDYAAKAFRMEATDYLLKPFDEEQLEETIKRIEKILLSDTMPENARKKGKLAVEGQNRIVYLAPDTIDYLYREGRETLIHSQGQKYSTKATLKEVSEKLQGWPFFRIHKSYIVNLQAVEELIPWVNGAYQLKIKGYQEELPVSRNFVKALREELEL